eukprot:11344271-Karenia_brevis.AAC.1
MNEEAGCHNWCWRSLTDKRVCRATLQGEAHGMLSGTEKMENVRLSTDIQGLKQMLWEKSDGTNLDKLLPEHAAESAVRRIDTSCMVVDCLTKRMKTDVLMKLTKSGRLSLRPTPESQLLKLRQQELRASRKNE